MLRQIQLHGALAERYGKSPVQFWFNSPKEIFRVLELVHPGSNRFIREHAGIAFVKEHNGTYETIGELELRLNLGSCEVVHVFLSTDGAGAEIVAYLVAAGMAEATAAAVVTTVISTAVSMAIGAVVQSFADTTQTKTESAVKAESTVFNGVKNIGSQGTRVPLLFGRFRGQTVTLNKMIKDSRVTTGKSEYIALTNISSQTLNVFENDYSKSSPVLQTFTIDGTTYNAGQTYSGSVFDVTCLANGNVTVTSKMNDFATLSFTVYAIDNSISYGQNVNVSLSRYVDTSIEEHG